MRYYAKKAPTMHRDPDTTPRFVCRADDHQRIAIATFTPTPDGWSPRDERDLREYVAKLEASDD